MGIKVVCPHYGCGVIQVVDAANIGQCVDCPNCGDPVLVPSEASRDRQSVGLLAAMTLIAGLTWYITQRAI